MKRSPSVLAVVAGAHRKTWEGCRGYKEFLEVYNDKETSGHEEMVKWAGEYFDPERLDLAEVNEILSAE